MPKIDPVKAGDVISEGLLNRIVDQFERFANLRTNSPYIRLWDGPYGKQIALALPQQTWGLLSGSSSPYSFTEVRDGPGGTWVSMPNGDSGSTNAYEVNGKSGLAGKVVPLTWTSAGDWRFAWVGYGCSANSLKLTLRSCDTCPLPGATVDIVLGGTVVFTGTTDSSGNLTYSGGAQPGSYDVNWSLASPAMSGTFSAAFVVTNACETLTKTLQIPAPTPATTYRCRACGPSPLPELFVTDNLGTRAFGPCVDSGTGSSVTGLFITASNCARTGTTATIQRTAYSGPGCTGEFGQDSRDNFAFSCERPISISGTYLFTGIAFLIHE